MAQGIGVQGLPLPPPTALYPTQTGVPPVPNVVGTNALSLPPGGAVIIPSDNCYIVPGVYSQPQILDSVSQTWVPVSGYVTGTPFIADSDGQNYRVANVTGMPIAAVVTNSGSGYTSAPTVTAGVGGSTWLTLLGPAVSNLTCPSTIATASGQGYTMPPIINIAAPPSPGVQATAVCAISGSNISSFTIINPGAGYTSVPTVVATPNPYDPNFSATSTTATKSASIVAQTSYAGQVCDVLLVNPATQVESVPPALSFSGGGGSGAAATAVLAQTITGVTVTTGGSGYPAAVGIQTFGGTVVGQTSYAGAGTNSPLVSLYPLMPPRQATIVATQGSGSGIGIVAIADGGLFTAPPVAYGVPGTTGGSGSSVAAVFGLTMGGANDTVFITPL